MEKFLLHTLLACNGLYIVYHKIVGIPVFIMKFISFLWLDSFNELVYKGFTCGVNNFQFRVIFLYLMLDSFHKVSFSKSRITVYDERVEYSICVRRRFLIFVILMCDSRAESIGKIIRFTFDKVIKGKIVVFFIRKVSHLDFYILFLSFINFFFVFNKYFYIYLKAQSVEKSFF